MIDNSFVTDRMELLLARLFQYQAVRPCFKNHTHLKKVRGAFRSGVRFLDLHPWPGLTNKSRTKRAGLKFSVGRMERYLRKGRYSARIGRGASIYLAGAIEYLVLEVRLFSVAFLLSV